jgi:hypothetical protein
MKTNKRILMITLALALAVFTVGCSFSVSTAKIEDAIMTNSVDADGKPGEEVVSFTADAAMLYTSAKIRNAPDNTQIRIVWTYVTENQLIDEIVVDSGTISDRYIYSNLEPTAALPLGDYQVQYFIDDRETPDATVKFVVVAAAAKAETTDGAYLEDFHMTSAVDASGAPVDNVTTLGTTGTWYVSSILRNTQPDTMIHYTWYDTNGNLIDSYDLDPKGATDVYVFGSFVLSDVAPEGQYRVEIFLDDATQPAGSVDFTVSNSIVNSATDSSDVTLYSQTEGGFSFLYPSSWVLQAFPENLGAWVYPADASIANENDINTAYVYANKATGAGYTTETLLQAWIDETEAESIENYAYVAKAVDTIDGREIASYSYSWSRGSYLLYTVDVLILDGSDFYVLTLTTTQDQYDAIYPLFEQMALSFKVL